MFLLCMYAATLPLSIVPDLRAADEFIEGNILHSAQRLSADMPASYHAADSNIGVPSPCMYSSMYVCMYVCINVYIVLCMCLGESMSVTAEVSDEVIRVGQYPGSLTVTCTFVIGEQL